MRRCAAVRGGATHELGDFNRDLPSTKRTLRARTPVLGKRQTQRKAISLTRGLVLALTLRTRAVPNASSRKHSAALAPMLLTSSAVVTLARSLTAALRLVVPRITSLPEHRATGHCSCDLRNNWLVKCCVFPGIVLRWLQTCPPRGLNPLREHDLGGIAWIGRGTDLRMSGRSGKRV